MIKGLIIIAVLIGLLDYGLLWMCLTSGVKR